MDEGKNSGIKIMMVDDDAYLLEMYVMKFKSLGFDVEKVNNTEQALEMLTGDQSNPDIIIFDMIMPGIDGLEFAKQLRANPKTKSKVLIALSNQSQQEDIDKAKAIGIDGYIVKALSTPSQVVQTVTELYSKREPALELKLTPEPTPNQTEISLEPTPALEPAQAPTSTPIPNQTEISTENNPQPPTQDKNTV